MNTLHCCFNSIFSPSTLTPRTPNSRNSNPIHSISTVLRQSQPKKSIRSALREDLHLVDSPVPPEHDSPIVHAEEETEEVVSDGFAESAEEDRVEGEDEEDLSGDERFKLRNGREVVAEKAYLVGIELKSDRNDSFGIDESLKELAQLADTAGLTVVGSTYQKLATPNPKTYIGSGKVAEIKNAIHALDVETVIFDDELSPGQLRNLEKAFGGDVRVTLAQMEYQLPRLTKMWTHLERQAGGKVKGMGEKQIEVDKRILRTQIGFLKKELDSVRKHRKQYRNRRISVPVPVVSLVGYTNAGKSTLLNRLTGANVLAEDRLFATLDPTTRRVQLKSGKEFLLTDTVGFIQKLPTTLGWASRGLVVKTLKPPPNRGFTVSPFYKPPPNREPSKLQPNRPRYGFAVAAFRATLEEISESSLLVHVVDISHPLVQQQIDAVDKVLSELDVVSIPKLMVWNKIDKASDPRKILIEAEERDDAVCVSALSGDGLEDFCDAVQAKLKDSMVWVEALVPFDKGELLNTIHRIGMVEETVRLLGERDIGKGSCAATSSKATHSNETTLYIITTKRVSISIPCY
ncbi:hypothetical protein Sjap_016976 [Stephania japonica]|uniref:Hflx-type G domain-containing protein n=1 Tax=Stephania japonica TaxID=461633 RepID=A0AAP0I5D3_9MAGN